MNSYSSLTNMNTTNKNKTTKTVPYVLRYTFDNDTTNTGSLGTSYNATPFNSPTYVTGKIGNAINFVDTSSQYVSIPSLSLGSSGVTITYWAKSNNNLTNNPFQFDLSTGSNQFLGVFMNAGNRLSLKYNNNNLFGTNTSYNDNLWHFYALIWKTDSTLKLYVDNSNTAILSQTITYSSTITTSVFTIGSGNDGSTSRSDFFKGAIDDFRLYKTALTTTELTNIYNLIE